MAAHSAIAGICAAILTLALAVGANTAMLSMLNALTLQRLAIEDPDELIAIRPRTARGPLHVRHRGAIDRDVGQLLKRQFDRESPQPLLASAREHDQRSPPTVAHRVACSFTVIPTARDERWKCPLVDGIYIVATSTSRWVDT